MASGGLLRSVGWPKPLWSGPGGLVTAGGPLHALHSNHQKDSKIFTIANCPAFTSVVSCLNVIWQDWDGDWVMPNVGNKTCCFCQWVGRTSFYKKRTNSKLTCLYQEPEALPGLVMALQGMAVRKKFAQSWACVQGKAPISLQQQKTLYVLTMPAKL